MRSHDPQLQRRLLLAHVVVALGQNRPRCRRPGLDANDFAHLSNRLGDVVVDIRLVSFTDERLDLLREDWA
jgi:hypothetical protein